MGNLDTATQAHEDAKKQLQEVRSNWEHVRSVACTLRAMREHNHYADRIRLALGLDNEH